MYQMLLAVEDGEGPSAIPSEAGDRLPLGHGELLFGDYVAVRG